MGETTGITWADSTFNPWRGCSKVSPGCAHCYAERDSKRFAAKDRSKPALLGEWGAERHAHDCLGNEVERAAEVGPRSPRIGQTAPRLLRLYGGCLRGRRVHARLGMASRQRCTRASLEANRSNARFPDDYILTGTKTSQVARIGNSVCPAMAKALVKANCPELRARTRKAAMERTELLEEVPV